MRDRTQLESKIIEIEKGIMNHDININNMSRYQEDIDAYYMYVVDQSVGWKDSDPEALRAFINVCLIVYTYSKTGSVLINDSQYDKAVSRYMALGGEHIYTTDYEDASQTKWEVIKHLNKNMVGTLEKSYNITEFSEIVMGFMRDRTSDQCVVLVPKYDGVSSCINVRDGKIVNATTRKDGTYGQNIIDVIRNASNYDDIKELIALHIGNHDGALKVELLCSKSSFEEIKDIYRNARSTVSAIVSTPKNLSYAKYLTIRPLLIKRIDNSNISYKYLAGDGVECTKIDTFTFGDTASKIEMETLRLLDVYRSSTFPFRIDGVVAYVKNNDPDKYTEDAMATVYAFKVNSAIGVTRVIRGYFSIGRGGTATPMLKVEPCDVNETTVEDVSLSNMKKVKSFGIGEGDTIEIEAAGDVIPMVKRVVKRNKHNHELKFDKHCPYCGFKLTQIDSDTSEIYACTNSGCPRVVSGKICNFFERMGLEGFSDEAWSDISTKRNVYTISGMLSLDNRTLDGLEGWGSVKIDNLLKEISRIKSAPINEAIFVGALGIPGIAEVKAKKLVSTINLDKMIDLVSRDKGDFLLDELLGSDGCGGKTARSVVRYFEDNIEEIIDIKNQCNIIPFTKKLGSFACTGFGEEEKYQIKKYLNDFGYDLGGVTKATIALIAINPNGNSTKIQKAQKYGIPIISESDISRFISSI